MSSKQKTVFISYSWDNTAHEEWVSELAERIRLWGCEAILDKTHLKFGGHIKTFMIRRILESDIVLMILTPKYKQKADMLQGGAGYEYNIINDELFKIITANEKFIPILREGTLEESATVFLKGLYCADLRNGPTYNDNLERLREQLTQMAAAPVTKNSKADPNMNEDDYKDLPAIVSEIKTKGKDYFDKLFVQGNPALTQVKLQETVAEWEETIEDYHQSFVNVFKPSQLAIYENYPEDFKTKIMAKQLWTVGSALKTPDPDLIAYKGNYRDADSAEVYTHFSNILTASIDYVNNVALALDYNTIASIDKLQMAYLNDESMFMPKIIGYGIRSEILHRYFPANFPIMTQKSLWGMYFLCESANEFIVVENRVREAKMRVSHNWQYPYDRFCFLMNILALELNNWFSDFGIRLRPELRFGYVNMFLTSISDHHKQDISMLHEWVNS